MYNNLGLSIFPSLQRAVKYFFLIVCCYVLWTSWFTWGDSIIQNNNGIAIIKPFNSLSSMTSQAITCDAHFLYQFFNSFSLKSEMKKYILSLSVTFHSILRKYRSYKHSVFWLTQKTPYNLFKLNTELQDEKIHIS